MMFLATGCIPSASTVYKDKDVKVVHHDTVNLFNVHASKGSMELKVKNFSYEYVCGYNQAFLRIPESDSILFFTGGNYIGHNVTPVFAHVFDLKTQQDISIKTSISSQGDAWIDASKNEVAIKSYDQHKLVVTFTNRISEIYELNLDEKTSTRITNVTTEMEFRLKK